MSWLFGSKKSKTPTSPVAPESVSANNLQVKDDGDFIMVDSEPKPSTAINDPPPLYPLIPGSTPGTAGTTNGIATAATTTTTASLPTNQIQGVPFRLSKDANLLASAEQSHQYILQRAQSAINNADLSAFSYDFSVEKSVIKETPQYTNE